MVLLPVVLRRLLLVVQVALLVRRILREFFMIALLRTHAQMALLIVSSAVWRFHAVAPLFAGRGGPRLGRAAGSRASQELGVIGSVVERIGPGLVSSLERLLLFLLHRVGVGVLVGAAWASEERAVGRRRGSRCGGAPLAELEILCGAILVDGRPHGGRLLESIGADALVGLSGTAPAEMPGRHLLTEVAQLPEPHGVMVLGCARATLMVPRGGTSILGAQAASVSASRRGGPLLPDAHRVPLIILLLGLLGRVRLILEALPVISVVILYFGGAHVAESTTTDHCQGRARRRARNDRRLQHSTSMRPVFGLSPISEGRIRGVQPLQLVHSCHGRAGTLCPASRRPLPHGNLLLLLLRLHESDLISFHTH